MMINKNRFRVSNDKKVLHKIGKRWVTVSALTLALLGGGVLAGSVTTHAASNQPQAAQTTKQPSATPKGIMKTASVVHANMLANAQKPVSSASAKSSVASQSASSVSSKSSSSNDAMNTLNLGTKSEQARGWNFVQNGVRNNDFDNTKPSVASSSSSATQSASSSTSASSVVPSNSVSASAKPSFNSAYQSYMAQMSGTDSEVASANAGNVQSDKKNVKKPLLKDNSQPDYFNGGVVKTGNDDGLNYKLYKNGGIEFTDGTAANGFRIASNLDVKAIKFDKGVNTQNITDMSNTFSYQNDLKSLDLDNFNTSNATDMSYMFASDANLQSLILPDSFDTSHVTNMSNMFEHNASLQSLKLPSSFNTSHVTNMDGTFSEDKSLRSLALPSSFDTSHVTNMGGMFQSDSDLQSLILSSSFNTSHVTNMSYMFEHDASLQSLTLPSSFDTSNVSDSSDEFANASSLKTIVVNSPQTMLNVVTNPWTKYLNDELSRFHITNWKQMTLPEITKQCRRHHVPNGLRMAIIFHFRKYLRSPQDSLVFYKKDSNDDYTSIVPNDFSKGNVGTFVTTKNPRPVTDKVIFYTERQDNDSQPAYNVKVGSTTVSGLDGDVKNVSDIFNNAKMNGYKLASNAPKTITLADGVMHKVDIDSTPQQANNSDDVPVFGNAVTFKGNIILNFPEKGSNHQIKVPYSINTKVDSKLSDILDEGIKNGYPSVAVPSDYVGKTIQQFNTQNFTYQNATSSPYNTYKGVYVQPANGTAGAASVTKNNDGSYTYNNPDITFNFTANTVPETIHYQYNGKDISNNPKDANGNQETNDPSTTTVSGANDTQGSLASNNVPAGWKIATGTNGEPNGNNSWIYGNGGSDASGKYSDSHNVNVVPNNAKATIQYQVSDGNHSSTNNGNILNTVTKNGNDYRTTDAGNNTFNANTPSDVPAGYHIINGQNTNVPYDNNVNGNHTVKIIGNEHNQAGRDTNPNNASTTNPSTLPKTDPNYVPASDVVTIKSVEYVAGNNTPVGTVTQYMAVSGKTGEKNSFNPNDYQPDGYSTAPNEPSQSVTIEPNGVTPSTVTFSYDAQTEDNITAVIQYKDNTGVEHTLARHDITGPTSSQGNVYTYKDSKNGNKEDLAIPQGYHFVNAFGGASGKTPEPSNVNGTNFPYTITPNAQDIIINVAGNTVTPKKSVTPTKPTVPSDNPVNPVNPSDVPSGKPNTPANQSDLHDTFYVTIKDWDGQRLVRTYQKRMTESGHIGDQFSVNPNTYITNGYSKTNSDNTYNGYIGPDQNGKATLLAGDDSTPSNNVTWNYTANTQHATITYQDQAGNTVTGTISGHTDSDINVTQPSDGNGNKGIALPDGYHVLPNGNYDYQFNTPTNQPNNSPQRTYDIEGNSISGTATINTSYNEESDNRTTHVDSTGQPTIVLNGHHVGDKIVVDPTNYEKDNYDDSNKYWTIPMDWNTVSHQGSVDKNTGDVINYNPSHSFTYYGPTAKADITYVDVSPGAQNDPEYNHQTRTFSDKTYPVVGHQIVEDLGTLGSTVNLTAIGSKVGDAVMIAPKGFHFVNDNSNDRVLVPNVHLYGGVMKFTLFLGADNPMPKPQPKPASSASAKPSSSASAQPSSASVAPSASQSVASSASSSTSSYTPQSAYVEPKGNTPEPVNTPTNSTPSNQPSQPTVKPQPTAAPKRNNTNLNKPAHYVPAKARVQKNTALSHRIVGKRSVTAQVRYTGATAVSHRHLANVRHEVASHMANVSNVMAQPTVHAADIHASHVNAGSVQHQSTQHKLPQTNEAKAAGLMGASAIMAALGLAGTDVDRKRRRN